jgi:hypothetical protein
MMTGERRIDESTEEQSRMRLHQTLTIIITEEIKSPENQEETLPILKTIVVTERSQGNEILHLIPNLIIEGEEDSRRRLFEDTVQIQITIIEEGSLQRKGEKKILLLTLNTKKVIEEEDEETVLLPMNPRRRRHSGGQGVFLFRE